MATAWAVAGLVTGRERQQSLSFTNQRALTARRPDPTRAHTRAHLLSLPPSANHFHGNNTPISFQRRHLQHLRQIVPLSSTLGYLYIQGVR